MKTKLMIQALCAALLASISVAPALAVDAYSLPTVSYDRLLIPIKNSSADIIEVRAFYGYDCAECARLNQFLSSWESTLADDVKLSITPVSVRGDWKAVAFFAQINQRANTSAEALAVHNAVFGRVLQGDFLWLDESAKNSFLNDSLLGSASSRGPSGSDRALAERLRLFKAQEKIHRIKRLPAIVVNGKYLFEGAALANEQELAKAIAYLMDQERVKQD